jgi:hypothetical protein
MHQMYMGICQAWQNDPPAHIFAAGASAKRLKQFRPTKRSNSVAVDNQHGCFRARLIETINMGVVEDFHKHPDRPRNLSLVIDKCICRAPDLRRQKSRSVLLTGQADHQILKFFFGTIKQCHGPAGPVLANFDTDLLAQIGANIIFQ